MDTKDGRGREGPDEIYRGREFETKSEAELIYETNNSTTEKQITYESTPANFLRFSFCGRVHLY